ncbi:MAG: Ig-like domain-containing protein, partial [Cocleimonas sp.]|nr:Ig-like domain-containing protein [Cocleimonas sp.]
MIIPTHLKRLTLPLLLSVALAGCSGGSDFGSGTGGGSKQEVTYADVASLEVSASSGVLLSKGANAVTISVVAKDRNNSVISEVPVTFAVDNSATISANSGNNSASIKTAILSSGMNTDKRTLTVTVTAGKKTQKVTVQVDDTLVDNTGDDPDVKSLDVSVTSNKLYSLGTNEVTISVLAKNEKNNVVPTAEMTFSVDGDALILPDAGNATAAIKTAKLSSGLGHPEARTLTVTVKSGTFVKILKIDVINAKDPVVEKESKVVALEISASSRQLFSAGVKPVIISAIAKDQNNNTLSDAIITFKVNNNATITPDAGNASAVVKTATVTPGLNHPENRTLDIEVMAGSLTKNLQVDIVGTAVILEGPDSIAINNPTEYTIKLQDSEKKSLAFHSVEITSSVGSEIVPVNGYTTNAIGEMSFMVKAVADGEDTITVLSLGAAAQKKVSISGNDFSLNSETEEIKIGEPVTISMKWTKDGVNQANKTIQLSATRGVLNPLTSIETNDDGEATFTIESQTAGGTVITATTENGLAATLEREFIATTPHYINTQASPSVIAPHGVSNLIAKVRDINDNPVKNLHIVFNLEDRINGTLSSSLAVTDSLGRANITYTASDVSSAKDGVNIKTYVQEDVTIKDQINLTVGGDALRIVLGHNEKIASDSIFYKKTYGVIVTDSAGNPVKDQEIAFTITPTDYYKGFMVPLLDKNPNIAVVDGVIITDNNSGHWVRKVEAACKSEDLDNDGNLDDGEDDNNNGTLEPSHDATVTTTGKTDEEGKLTIQVVYPQSSALWSRQLLTSTVVVEGTEFVEHVEFDLPILASAVDDLDVSPPNHTSPYGINADCSSTETPVNSETTPTTPTVFTPVETVCATDVNLGEGGSVFCIDSSPKSYVAGGKSFKVMNDSFIFDAKRPYGENSPNDLNFTLEGNIGFDAHRWSLNFAPIKGKPLEVGVYKFASRYPFQAVTQPGMSFSGDGRGNNTLSAHFEVLEVEFNEADVLQRFAVNFLMFSGNQASKWTIGKIRYKSTIPLSTSSIFTTDSTDST